jgi:phosphoribosyl 1,2-cyclic phosphate phosphodiesterase
MTAPTHEGDRGERESSAGSHESLRVTVLGSGTSMGVPSLGCHCRVCSSSDPRDNRLRPSLLISRGDRNIIIDTTPDFRQQALRAKIESLDAVLLTHSHADHILGFDDIRAFNIRQKAAMPVYGTEETFKVLRRAFAYVFDGRPTLSMIPTVQLHVIDGPFTLMGITITPIPLVHGDMEVLGFRFERAAYLTDFSSVPASSMSLLTGLDDLILDALRDIPHPMHQTVNDALTLIDKLAPRRAWFTHIAHDLGHAETTERLRQMGRKNVRLAYDGLQFDVALDEAVEAAKPQVIDTGEQKSPRPSRTVKAFSSGAAWSAHYGDSRRGSVLTIGNYDGIHLGHQAILRAAVDRAGEMRAVATALTFDPPPLKVLRPESAPLRLSTNAQRMSWFGVVGMESAVVLPFTMELARLTPEGFVSGVLVNELQVRAVLVGENFRFGHRQIGDVKLLRELGMRDGFDVIVIPPVAYRGEVVSSTVIRREIAAGDVTHGGRLLGRPFVLTGEIVPGTGAGRRFTFPTLNLVPEQEQLPARGVYVTRTVLEGEMQSRRSVTNVGVRPTFGGSKLSVETHLLDYSGNVMTKRIELRFWKRLREEMKFSGPEELREQIGRDINSANRFFRLLRRFRAARSSRG